MTLPNNKSCAKCWYATESQYTRDYVCRVNPPAVVLGEFHTPRTIWPVVTKDDWCGRFVLRGDA